MQYPYTSYAFSNIGYLIVDINEQDLKPIKDEIKIIETDYSKAEPFNNNLAGNIEKEYVLKNSFNAVDKIVAPYIKLYIDHFNYLPSSFSLTKDVPIALDKPWVNFMQKYEFNPPHTHSGLFSFVIWIDVPYDIKNEMSRKASINSASNSAGHFGFIQANALGELRASYIPVDKTYNNKMAIFPASMMHFVNPFYTSDEYRISVAGNYLFKVN